MLLPTAHTENKRPFFFFFFDAFLAVEGEVEFARNNTGLKRATVVNFLQGSLKNVKFYNHISLSLHDATHTYVQRSGYWISNLHVQKQVIHILWHNKWCVWALHK